MIPKTENKSVINPNLSIFSKLLVNKLRVSSIVRRNPDLKSLPLRQGKDAEFSGHSKG